ncbi:Endonuclease/exonuclease/phosphatase [Ganoderma leucocontextum]|nr:Endonuclease/exonuclease/phosphatase [Ganoderma leucocontextum]
MNGFGSLQPDHVNNKWGRIARVMNEHRIGVLLLQETHLTDERQSDLQRLYMRSLAIFHSPHPEFPTQREGVAIVVNKKFVAAQGATAVVIVPGRALQLSLQCLGGDTLNILCIYAPTTGTVDERKQFFKDVQEYYETHQAVPKPHLMAGDFNNVEDAIDRLPIGEPPDSSIEDLDALKQALGLMLVDGWRETYPMDREYTFHRVADGRATLSRLDRIYIKESMRRDARDWKITESASEEPLVSVQLTTANSPSAGPGRPVFPLCLMKDKVLKKEMKKRGLEAIKDLDSLDAGTARTENFNAQVVLHKMKSDMMAMARKRERETIPKLLAEIRMLEQELTRLKKEHPKEGEDRAKKTAALTRQVSELKLKRTRQLQQNSRARFRKEGEKPTKYWTRLNKECTPREPIPAFECEGQRTPADPAKMADLARNHHSTVQQDDASAKPPGEREVDIAEALNSLDTEVTEEQAEGMAAEITYSDCDLALPPGLDGVQYEVYIEDSRFEEREAFDILHVLQAAFADTGFADGWMSLIYKEKGERTRVVNYRPITLLNTDYKLLTKILAIRLASASYQVDDFVITHNSHA